MPKAVLLTAENILPRVDVQSAIRLYVAVSVPSVCPFVCLFVTVVHVKPIYKRLNNHKTDFCSPVAVRFIVLIFWRQIAHIVPMSGNIGV